MLMKVSSADRKLMRDVNLNQLLNLIRFHAPISRTKLAELSGLSPSTVFMLTNELIARQFVFESGVAESTGGRKATLLEIHSKGGYAIGLMLREYEMVGVVVNLQNSIVDSRHWDVALFGQNDEVLSLIAQRVEELIALSGIAKEHIIGVGCAISGYIDAENGIAVDSWQLGWHQFELGKPLAERLGIPVFIDNNVSCITNYEKLSASGQSYQHFLIVAIGRGLGLGIVLNGDIYRGVGGAGEFGHIVAVPNGRYCECHKQGCLEAYVAYRGVIATYKELCQKAEQEPLTGEENMEDFIDQLKILAHQGDRVAQQTFIDTSVLLGMNLANVVNLLHPECIIFTGEGIASYDYMFESMLQTLHKHIFSHLGDHLHTIFEPWTGYECWARGAAALVLHRFFSAPVSSPLRS